MSGHGNAPGDLRERVVSGVGWIMASQVAIQILSLATSVVIARFLSPREVGLAVMGVVFVNLALLLADGGLGSALVQRPQLTEEDKSTAFWTSIVLGTALTLAGVALSWPLASLYGEPQVQKLFAVLSLSYLFAAPGIVQGALLTRELNFRNLEVRTIVATVASCSAAIALAVIGVGPWAIVGQHLTITFVSTALLWRSSTWRPSRQFSLDSLRSFAGFSGNTLAARFFAWAGRNVDNLLVGRFLGAASLGVYSLAFNLMVTPVTRIAGPVTRVFYPAFSRLREPTQIAPVWLRAVRMVALVVVPAMLGVIAVAPDFVEVVFGRRWQGAAPVLQILAPVGLAQALQALNYGVLQSLARTRELMRYNAVASVVTVGAFASGLPWGIKGAATTYAAASLVLEPFYLLITTRAVGISPRDWLRSIGGITLAGLGMVAALLAARAAMVHAGLPPGARLPLLLAVGALVYFPLVVWRAPQVLHDLRTVLADRRRRSIASAERARSI